MEDSVIVCCSGLIGSLYPDVDSEKSIMGQATFLTASSYASLRQKINAKDRKKGAYLGHRKFTHSVAFWGIIGLLYASSYIETLSIIYFLIITVLSLINIFLRFFIPWGAFKRNTKFKSYRGYALYFVVTVIIFYLMLFLNSFPAFLGFMLGITSHIFFDLLVGGASFLIPFTKEYFYFPFCKNIHNGSRAEFIILYMVEISNISIITILFIPLLKEWFL